MKQRSVSAFPVLAFVVALVALSIPVQAEEASAIARGGLLYDKWYAVIGAEKPAETRPGAASRAMVGIIGAQKALMRPAPTRLVSAACARSMGAIRSRLSRW